MSKINRNDPCPCGSGKKYKKCCGLKEAQDAGTRATLFKGLSMPGGGPTTFKSLSEHVVKVIQGGSNSFISGKMPDTSEVVEDRTLEAMPDDLLPPPQLDEKGEPLKPLF